MSAGSALPPTGAVSPPKPPDTATTVEVARLTQAAREFEAIFLGYVLKGMREALGDSGGFGVGAGHKIYRDLMDQELARAMARGQGLGLADFLVRELIRLPAPKEPSSPLPGRPIIRGQGPRGSDGGRS